MPGVLSTPGLPRGGDARGAARGRAGGRDGLDLRMRMNARFLGRTVASGAHLGLYEHGTYHILVVKAYKQYPTGRITDVIHVTDVTFEFEFEPLHSNGQ